MAIPASIDTLKSTIGVRGGLAKANRFAIYLTHPSKKEGLFSSLSTIGRRAVNALVGQGSFGLRSFIEDPRDMFLLCDSVTMPGRQIMTSEYTTGLKPYKKPYGIVEDEVQMVFNLTEDYYVFDYFRSWQNSIIAPVSDKFYEVQYKEQYCTDVIIQQISGGQDFIPTYSVKLKNAFPITLSSVQLANTAESQTLQCTVSFGYDTWEEMGAIESLGSVAQNIGTRLLNTFS